MFDGQQQGERILFEIRQHHVAKTVRQTAIIVLAAVFFAVVMIIGTAVPAVTLPVRVAGTILCIAFLSVGLWYTQTSYENDRTYITDRRIIRFETTTPLFHAKRALFWSEALKAKAFAPNLLYRWLNIGTLAVEPVMGDGESVRVTDVEYYEDLANYIDKILYTVKNAPSDIRHLTPFVAKPRGHRG